MERLTIRGPVKRDLKDIKRILNSADEFNEEEASCALELVGEALKRGNSVQDYAVLCAELGGSGVAGYLCYGKTPLTRSTYDLYWIETDPRYRRKGVGRSLISRLISILRGKDASLLIAETSSQPSYRKARDFYEKHGFRMESCLKDFYAPGDHRLTYCYRY